jgi:hypothetical protein
MNLKYHFFASLWRVVELLVKLLLYAALLMGILKISPVIVAWLVHYDRWG